MFVGFIAVVVILLVIVGLMSSGATNGSGGVDQTKATKALSEISALVQSTGFYKTTTEGSNYAGLTVDQLIASGIVSDADLYTTVAADNVKGADGVQIVAGTKLVKSRAVSGIYYNIVENTNGTATVNDFEIVIAADSDDITTSLAAALEKAYTKLSATSVVTSGASTTDGAAIVTSK